ncbi:MAG: hypothetical protein V4543_00820 [Bacteroidota bacterium]
MLNDEAFIISQLEYYQAELRHYPAKSDARAYLLRQIANLESKLATVTTFEKCTIIQTQKLK